MSHSDVLKGFTGELEWVHKQEDRRWAPSAPYWPGGSSGVTLRPGVDIGYCRKPVARAAYVENPKGQILSVNEWSLLKPHFGTRGRKAHQVVKDKGPISSIDISYEEGRRAFPYVAEKYWEGITKRFPALLRPSVPGAVHTALLSLAFNRGIWNRDLSGLEGYIESESWMRLGQEISNMQQNHSLQGIQKRRRKEGRKVRRAARLIRFANQQGDMKAADLVPL